MAVNEDIAKILFEEAKKLMFNSNEYNSLREKYGISIKNIKFYIDDYISRNFNLADDEIKIYKRTYKNFILFASPNRTKQNTKDAFTFNQLFATNEEKNEFKRRSINILKHVIELQDQQEIENYLESIGLHIVHLYKLAIAFCKNKQLLLLIISFFKDIYENCVLKNFYSYKLDQDARVYQIFGNDYVKLGRLYEKYFITKQQVERKQPNKYIDILLEYLHSDKSLQEIADANNIHTDTLKHATKELDDQDLQNQLLFKIENEASDKKNQLISRYLELIQCLKKGINGKPFDLIDFYLYFSDINILRPYRTILTGHVSCYEMRLLTNLTLNFCLNNTKINKETIIKSHVEVNCEKDEFGMPIKGTGIILNEDEIASIIIFMETNNIPLYDMLFNIAVQRYINNTLDISLQEKRN